MYVPEPKIALCIHVGTVKVSDYENYEQIEFKTKSCKI